MVRAPPSVGDSNSTADVVSVPGLRDLWLETLGDERICIAVLDGNVDFTHPCFAGANLAQIKTLASFDKVSGAAARHATHVASVIFGRHGSSVAGIAPNCRGLVAPIFTDVVDGTPSPCSQVDLARALLEALDAGANIINISGGQFSPSGTPHPLLADAVRTCTRSGALIVAATGNQGCECLHIPGAMPSVLAVGAMNWQGEPMSFSNWGDAYQTQGILAPGENIVGAIPGGGTATESGTSFATPIVSGVAALLLSIQRKRGQKPDVTVVRNALIRGALGCEFHTKAECRRLLAGRLDVRRSLSILDSGERVMSVLATASASISSSSIHDPLAKPSGSVNGSVAETESGVSLPRADENSSPNASQRFSANVAPSGCGCGGGTSTPRLVYALGQLGYDFGSEARRDAFVQIMSEPSSGVANPHDPHQLLSYLQNNPWDSASLIWTLSLDGTVIYAVIPQGPFAGEAYLRLREFLKDQFGPDRTERISVPGIITGKARLMNGQTVPVITPEIRGMYSWTTRALVQAVVGGSLSSEAPQAEIEARAEREADLREFLARVYFEMRNLGITPQDRAINYAGTNAFNIEKVYESAAKEKLDLDSIEVERSAICRPESDCWDVKLFFFFPERHVQTVRKVYRFTVDVSDVVPVTVGPVRSWFVR